MLRPSRQYVEDEVSTVRSEEKFVAQAAGKSVRELLSQFYELAVPYFRETSEGKWLLARVIGLTLMQSGVSVAFSYLSRDFYNALSAKDVGTFGKVLLKFSGALAAGVPVTVLYRFERETLSLRWRRWLTDELLGKYCDENKKYYELEYVNKSGIDNPDQRLAEDVSAFATVALSFGITALTSVVDLASFSTILYSIYAPLFGAIIIYATAGSALTAYVGRSLPGRNLAALRSEADFRYALVRLRENAEAVAFYNGSEVERERASQRLDSAIDAQRAVIAGQRNVEFVTVAYRFLVQVLPVAVVAPLYFEGRVELGVVTQSASSFNHVLGDLSALVNQYEAIAAFSAGLQRLSAFVDRLEDTNAKANGSEQSPTASGLLLEARGVCVQTPDGSKALVKKLDLEIRPGQSVLVTAASGAGKSSLLRTLAGLWLPAKGTVKRVPDVAFLPQRPYCSLGSLRDQLLYPRKPGEHRDDAPLLDALDAVGLRALAEIDPTKGLDLTRDWAAMLSLGEQQRLAFARLVLAKPRIAVLDESTSALGLEDERAMYHLLKRNSNNSIALLSVGHRPSLLEHHDLRLRLDGRQGDPECTPELEPVKDDDRDAAAVASSLF